MFVRISEMLYIVYSLQLQAYGGERTMAEERNAILLKSGFKTKWFRFYVNIGLLISLAFTLFMPIVNMVTSLLQSGEAVPMAMLFYYLEKCLTAALIIFTIVQLKRLTYCGYVLNHILLLNMLLSSLVTVIRNFPQASMQYGELGTIAYVALSVTYALEYVLQFIYFKKRKALFLKRPPQ